MGIIIKPLVTEKMTAITDKSNNRFGFIVRPEANKLEIKKEVEALYNVTVVDVNTMKYAGKNKSFDLLGYEFSLTSKEVKNIFYRNTGVGLLILAGGIVLWTKCRKR